MKKSHFQKCTVLRDSLAVRCAEFNSSGERYAVGSNSRNVYICQMPSFSNITDNQPKDAKILKTFNKHHKGSIYCLSWSPDGQVLATGSNDKTIKLTKVPEDNTEQDDDDEALATTLNIHEGTVRDLSWMSGGQILISAGAGEDQIFQTDCTTGEVVQVRAGHAGHVMCVGTWQDSHVYVTGGQDGAAIFWDSRTAESVHKVKGIKNGEKTNDRARQDKSSENSLNSVCVDPTGRLLVTANQNGDCVLHDIRGDRQLQILQEHNGEVRCARLCPPATHLVSVGYDGKLILTDLQGDITSPRASICVARHRDKVVNVRWHPEECCLITSSADKTAVIWTLKD